MICRLVDSVVGRREVVDLSVRNRVASLLWSEMDSSGIGGNGSVKDEAPGYVRAGDANFANSNDAFERRSECVEEFEGIAYIRKVAWSRVKSRSLVGALKIFSKRISDYKLLSRN